MLKRKPKIVGKQKSLKRVMEYERTREDKSRRKAIPRQDAGTLLVGDSYIRHRHPVLDMALRQSNKAYKLVIRKMKENDIMLGVIVFLVGVWLSGWFAAKGMAFEALLSVVVGVLIPATIMAMKGKE